MDGRARAAPAWAGEGGAAAAGRRERLLRRRAHGVRRDPSAAGTDIGGDDGEGGDAPGRDDGRRLDRGAAGAAATGVRAGRADRASLHLGAAAVPGRQAEPRGPAQPRPRAPERRDGRPRRVHAAGAGDGIELHEAGREQHLRSARGGGMELLEYGDRWKCKFVSRADG